MPNIKQNRWDLKHLIYSYLFSFSTSCLWSDLSVELSLKTSLNSLKEFGTKTHLKEFKRGFTILQVRKNNKPPLSGQFSKQKIIASLTKLAELGNNIGSKI